MWEILPFRVVSGEDETIACPPIWREGKVEGVSPASTSDAQELTSDTEAYRVLNMVDLLV